MAYRFAYYFPGVGAMQLRDAPVAAFLRAAWGVGEWTDQQHGSGTLSVWPKGNTAVTVDAFKEPRQLENGILYYPSIEAPPMDELIRPEAARGAGEWLLTTRGDSLFVPLATATPRQILIGRAGLRTGDYVTALGILAHEVYDLCVNKADRIQDDDPRLLRLIQEALRHGYQVTDDMLEDGLPCILSSTDINQLLSLLFGLDPKASAADPAQSPSAQAPTPTAP